MLKYLLILLLVILTHAEKNYSGFVKDLKDKIEDPSLEFRHRAWNTLAYITDTYGPRMWGSDVLETVIQELADRA